MRAWHTLVQMTARVAEALGPDLCQEMAFVGGVTTGFLLTDDFSREQARSTDDVDLIVHVMGTNQFHQLQADLQKKGFVIEMPAPDEEPPVCAMKLDGMRVDFMPDDKDVLGFTNIWYREALASAEPYPLPDGQEIRLVSPLYFMATKLEAWKGRGGSNALDSRDIEDLLLLIDGREQLIDEMKRAPEPLGAYIAAELQILLDNRDFEMAMESQAQGDAARRNRLRFRLEQLARLRPS